MVEQIQERLKFLRISGVGCHANSLHLAGHGVQHLTANHFCGLRNPETAPIRREPKVGEIVLLSL